MSKFCDPSDPALGTPWRAAAMEHDQDEADQGTKLAAKIQAIMERATDLAQAALADPRKDVSISDVNRLLDTVVKAGNYVEGLKKTVAGQAAAADLLPSMTDKELLRELAEYDERTGEAAEQDPLALPEISLPPKA